MFGLDKNLFIASRYLSLIGSSQLQHHDLTSRLRHLQSSATLAMQHGYVLLGGDFNARVADLSHVSSHDLHDQAFLVASGGKRWQPFVKRNRR